MLFRSLLGMVLKFKASRIATLCGLSGPRWGWVGAVCPRCRARGGGGGKGSTVSVENSKTVRKQTAFYYHHVSTVPDTVVINTPPCWDSWFGPSLLPGPLPLLWDGEQPKRGIQKGHVQERSPESSTW